MNFLNRSVKVRLYTVIGVTLAIMVIVGGAGVWGMSNVMKDLDHVYHTDVKRIEFVSSLQSKMQDAHIMLLGAINADNDSAIKQLETRGQQDQRAFSDLLDKYLASLSPARRQSKDVQQLQALQERYWDNFATVTQHVLAGDESAVEQDAARLADQTGLYIALQEVATNMIAFNNLDIEASYQHAEQSFRTERNVILVVCLLALLLCASAGGWLIRSIVRPLMHAEQAARTTAEGDLTYRIAARGQDEFGRVLHSLVDMQARLKDIIRSARTSSHTVAAISDEVASSSSELSTRTQEQASSLEETAASMEEITSTIRHNSENTRQAERLVQDVTSQTRESDKVVGRAMSAMGSIRESSDQIVSIVSVMDDIAFQTNLLALNASVEAARAGEQGRGFAVVASEVRILANRSATAAQEIRSLITESVGRVQEGAEQVEMTSGSLKLIVQNVERVNDLMSEMAAAGREQSQGVDQINIAVSEMDGITQQNAALVEEAAASSQVLSEQAQALRELIDFFRIDDEQLTPSPNRVAPERASSERVVSTSTHDTPGRPAPDAPRKAPERSVPASQDDWETF
ncbi:methyl-accepting chemotaxis protein [Larsenimonas rhizosphaerae]|uniref:Methyl-accepting chemotaxis protein n=1 Tax=Larsenimonas rhizosphaerae TaxID=2944682 RepID=A0AA41ZH51_9GAMM|nr:methyl-accepting chemotaxis protein [Larsenimonas rhizosphaerae]MCX2524581.1 methyl-accepting chemotaxis protein [Larsenimonas rhizosphaerae]